MLGPCAIRVLGAMLRADEFGDLPHLDVEESCAGLIGERSLLPRIGYAATLAVRDENKRTSCLPLEWVEQKVNLLSFAFSDADDVRVLFELEFTHESASVVDEVHPPLFYAEYRVFVCRFAFASLGTDPGALDDICVTELALEHGFHHRAPAGVAEADTENFPHPNLPSASAGFELRF